MENSPKIVIVEDEMIMALSLKRALGKIGFGDIEILNSGQEALEKIPEILPDLILMDIFLCDEVDGIEVIEAVHKTTHIPVIYISASSDTETFERASQTKMVGFIQKPYKFEEVNRLISTVLNQNS